MQLKELSSYSTAYPQFTIRFGNIFMGKLQI